MANQNNGALNYNVRFGNGQNYDSFESSSNEKTKSFWQKWKGIIIGGAGLLCVSILGVIGYNKGWFKKVGDKIKEIAGKNSSKAASNAQENVQNLETNLKTLNINSNQKFEGRTISEMIKKGNVKKAELQAVTKELSKKTKTKENQAAIIFILNQLRQHLSDEIKGFNKDKEISENSENSADKVLETILSEEEPKAKEPKAEESKVNNREKTEESKPSAEPVSLSGDNVIKEEGEHVLTEQEITEEEITEQEITAKYIEKLKKAWDDFKSSTKEEKSSKVSDVAYAFIDAINALPNNTNIKDIALETLNQFYKEDLIKNSNMIPVIKLLCQTVRNRNSQDSKENQDLKDKTNNITNNILSKIQSLINDSLIINDTCAYSIVYSFITTKDLESINPDLYESILDKCFKIQHVLVDTLSRIVTKDNYKDKLNLDFISKYMQKHKTEGENSTYSIIKDDIEEEEKEEIKNKIKEILLNKDSEEIQNETTRNLTANLSPLVNSTTSKPSEAPVEQTQPTELIPSGGGSGRISDTSDIPDNTYHEYDYDKTNFTSFNVKAIDEMRQKQIQKIKEINSANVEEYKENTINFLKIVDSNFEKIKNNPILLNKICNYLTSILNQNNSILYLAIHNNEEGRGVFNNIFYKLSAKVEEQSTGNEYMEDFFCDYFKCCQYKLYKADKKEKKIALENVIKLKQLRHNTNMSDINLNLINDFLYLGLWNFSKKEDKETDTALFNQFIDFTLQDNTTKHYALSYIIQAQTMGYELKEEYKNKLLNMIENVQKPELWSYLDKQATNINNMRQLGFYNIDKDGTIFQALTKKLKELDPGNKRKFLFYEEQEEVTPNRNCEFLTRVKNIQLFNNFLIQNPNIKTVYSITQDDLANMLTKIINTPNLSTDDLNEMRQELENLEKSIAQYRLLLRSNPEESKIIGITKNTVDNLVVIKKELEELIVFLTNEQKQDNEKEEKINRIKTCCEKITSNVERKTKFDFDIDTYLEAQENTNDEDNTKKYDYSYMIQSAHSKVNSNYDSSDTNVLLIALNSYVYRNNFSKNITNSQEYKNFRKIIRDNMELIDDKTAGVGTINGTLIDKYIENFSYIQQ